MSLQNNFTTLQGYLLYESDYIKYFSKTGNDSPNFSLLVKDIKDVVSSFDGKNPYVRLELIDGSKKKILLKKINEADLCASWLLKIKEPDSNKYEEVLTRTKKSNRDYSIFKFFTAPLLILSAIIFIYVLANIIFKRTNNTSSNALAMSQVFVQKKLLSPSTAKFPGEMESTITHLDNIWDVDSYVDAENAFGAKIRSYYHCQLRYKLNTDKWYLLNFYFK